MRSASILSATILSLGFALPAAATGTLGCMGTEGDMEVFVQGVVPYGMPAPLLQVQAQVTSDLPNVGTDLSTVSYDSAHKVQYWLDETTLNLLFYRERNGRGPFGSSTLTIRSTHGKGDEEGGFHGTFRVDASDMPEGGSEAVTVTREGKIECFVG